MFESENRKSSNQNRKIKIGIIEAEIRIEATQLTRRILTALIQTQLTQQNQSRTQSTWIPSESDSIFYQTPFHNYNPSFLSQGGAHGNSQLDTMK